MANELDFLLPIITTNGFVKDTKSPKTQTKSPSWDTPADVVDHPEYAILDEATVPLPLPVYPKIPFFDQPPDIDTSEILDEVYAKQAEAENSVEELFAGSQYTLQKMLAYLHSRTDITVVADTEVKPEQQFFHWEGKRYLLEKNHINDLHAIILDMEDFTTLAHTLKKRPQIVTQLSTAIEGAIATSANPFITTVTPLIYSKVILKVLNNLIQTNLLAHQPSTHYHLNAFTTTLGTALYSVFMELIFYSKPIHTAEELLVSRTETVEALILRFLKEVPAVITAACIPVANSFFNYNVTTVAELRVMRYHIYNRAINQNLAFCSPLHIELEVTPALRANALTLGLAALTILVDHNFITEFTDDSLIFLVLKSSHLS